MEAVDYNPQTLLRLASLQREIAAGRVKICDCDDCRRRGWFGVMEVEQPRGSRA